MGLRITLASTLRRPRWGIPITIDSTPRSADVSMSAFMPGISASQPSSPKRLAAVYLLARNDSNISDHVSRSRMLSFFSAVYAGGSAVSRRARSQLHLSRSGMCMYS